jgi:hypothetical protein
MADREAVQKAGDFDLDGALIVGSSGQRVNVLQQIIEINIYQNIETPYMSGSIMISDSAGVAELLPFLGQERLLFTLRTPSRVNEVSFQKYHAIIYNVESRFNGTEREHVFILNWTTLDHYKNMRLKVSQSFSGIISSIAQKILTDEDLLGSNKPLNIEPTKNLRKYVIPNINPFQAINLIKNEAVSMFGSPHFLFFENPEGYHFRSLDSLIGKTGSLSVKHKKTFKTGPTFDPNDIESSTSNIYDWKVEDNSNSFLGVKLGMYASTLYYHDIFNKNFQKFEYDYIKDSYNKRNTTSQGNRSSGALVSGAKIDDKKTITEFPDSKIFLHPTASKEYHASAITPTPNTDNNADEWLQETESKKLMSDYFTLMVETYGDTNIMVGDMIEILIPANKPLPAKGVDTNDPVLSGRYLITSLHHLVVPRDQMHTMTMTVMKDSFNNSAASKDTQYPNEPSGSADVGLSNTSQNLTVGVQSVDVP